MSVSRRMFARFADPDSELVALGRKLDALLAEKAAPEALRKEREAAWRATGNGYAMLRTNPAGFWRSRRKCGLDEAVMAHNKVLDRIDAVSARIRSIEPKTFAGLAVKAKAAKGYARELWEEDADDLDYGKLMIRRLVDEVLRLGDRPG